MRWKKKRNVNRCPETFIVVSALKLGRIETPGLAAASATATATADGG